LTKKKFRTPQTLSRSFLKRFLFRRDRIFSRRSATLAVLHEERKQWVFIACFWDDHAEKFPALPFGGWIVNLSPLSVYL
jgi:hypothetical protein